MENKDEIFQLLSENAFKTLIKSLKMLEDEELKYTVIIFCHGMELLLKARIVKEHWSLICETPGSYNLEEFRTGKFKSIGIGRAIDLLEKISNESMDPGFRKCMFELVKHRNQFMHFFHIDAFKSNEAVEYIIALQLRSLGYLEKCNFYIEYFNDYRQLKNELYLTKKGNSKYLKEKFEIEKTELDELKANGEEIALCPACEFMSFFDHVCRVCGYDESNAILITKDNHDEFGETLCPNCEVTVSISNENNEYCCLKCKQLYNEISQCEYCGSKYLGHIEDSYLEGCGQCEGHPDWG